VPRRLSIHCGPYQKCPASTTALPLDSISTGQAAGADRSRAGGGDALGLEE